MMGGPLAGHAATAYVRRTWAPEVVVAAPGRTTVTLLLVTEWLDELSVHVAWPDCGQDKHRDLREAYHLADAAGRTCPVVASTVQSLAGRMNEVTFFDVSRVSGPQTLALRLRSRLGDPVPVPFGG
jgi:hypothetical protein